MESLGLKLRHPTAGVHLLCKMESEKKSFFATPKGIATIVVGVVGVGALGLVVFGAHQGWFSSPSPKVPESDVSLEADEAVATDEDK